MREGRLARRVGPNGIVYAEDIQRLMIEAIQRRVQKEGLTNVRTVLGTRDDPRLPAASLDAVLIVDAFHEMDAPVPVLRNAARALKPQGLIGIVDFLEGEGGPGPAPEERVAPAVVNVSTAQVVEQEVAPFPMWRDPTFDQFFRDFFESRRRPLTRTNLGSGVIIRADGYVLTNQHVVLRAQRITDRVGTLAIPARLPSAFCPCTFECYREAICASRS